MARIRSVHPGLFTDEAFASVSVAARILFIGIWTECDDFGAFEWKPIGLKMRIMPADAIDVVPLLAELAAVNMVRQYAHDGRQYGLVRNFCRYQRPKKPKAVHFIPSEFRTYVGSSAPSGELDEDDDAPVPPKSELDPVQPPQVPPKSEIAPQMEDGGWRMEDGKKESKKRRAAPDAELAFAGKVVRLKREVLDGWRKAYGKHLDLDAQLTARDAWLSSDKATDSDRKNWFVSTATWLANKATEAKARASPEAAAPFQRWAL